MENPDTILMDNYDGNEIYKELNHKISAEQELTDVDMLNLIFLPLMRNTIPRNELAVNSVKLAQTIADITKRDACIAAAFAFGSKYLNKKEMRKMREVLNVDVLAELIEERAEERVEERLEERVKERLEERVKERLEERVDERLEEHLQEGIQKHAIESAKEMLKENEPIEKITRYLRLDESTIIKLKSELSIE